MPNLNYVMKCACVSVVNIKCSRNIPSSSLFLRLFVISLRITTMIWLGRTIGWGQAPISIQLTAKGNHQWKFLKLWEQKVYIFGWCASEVNIFKNDVGIIVNWPFLLKIVFEMEWGTWPHKNSNFQMDDTSYMKPYK